MLKRFWEGWKRVGQWIGDMVARVILTLFYFTIFLPFGLMARLFSDSLGLKTTGREHWVRRGVSDKSLEDVRSQY
jgi:hypothetical protein